MKMSLFLCALLGCSGSQQKQAEPRPEGLPAGFRLLYAQDFDAKEAQAGFSYSDPKAWRIHTERALAASGKAPVRAPVKVPSSAHGRSLELHGKSRYRPKVRSPFNLALIRGLSFGDFVLEADLRQTGLIA